MTAARPSHPSDYLELVQLDERDAEAGPGRDQRRRLPDQEDAVLDSASAGGAVGELPFGCFGAGSSGPKCRMRLWPKAIPRPMRFHVEIADLQAGIDRLGIPASPSVRRHGGDQLRERSTFAARAATSKRAVPQQRLGRRQDGRDLRRRERHVDGRGGRPAQGWLGRLRRGPRQRARPLRWRRATSRAASIP